MTRSIKARLTLLFVGILAAILTAFSATLYLTARQELATDLDRRTEEEARASLAFFFEQLDEVARGVHPSLEGQVRQHLDTIHAVMVVYDADRGVLFRSEALAEVDLPFEDVKAGFTGRVVESAGTSWRCLSRRAVGDTGGREYYVAFGLDAGPVRARLSRLLLFFALFVPIVLAVSSYGGWLLVGRALAPVETLRRKAERISRSNLSERVPLPETHGELQELAATFNEMLERLERAFEQMQTFTSNASHELKTPLANLRSEIELALARQGNPMDYPRLLASIAEEVARMTRVVENMLLLAQLDARQAALKRERIDLSGIAAEVTDVARAMGEARHVEVADGWIAPGVQVVGDDAALRRVMMNLVENAIKYNREGGQVKLAVWAEDGTARVEVSDNGPGIPPEHVPHLFRRFHRVDKMSGKGTGLGLSICKLLVEAHGGTIDVKSRSGVGTTFTVTLPREMADRQIGG